MAPVEPVEPKRDALNAAGGVRDDAKQVEGLGAQVEGEPVGLEEEGEPIKGI